MERQRGLKPRKSWVAASRLDHFGIRRIIQFSKELWWPARDLNPDPEGPAPKAGASAKFRQRA